MYVHARAIVHVHAACTPRQASEMEPSHPKTPTVTPLTRNLIEQIMKQQQMSAPLQVAAGQVQRSAQVLAAGQAQRSAPRLAAGQPLGKAQMGAGQQTATVLSHQSRATAVNLTGLGDHHHAGRDPGSSHTAISVQVLNNNAKSTSEVVSQAPPIWYTYKVKIINPNKKSVTIVRYLHNMTSKFESVNGLRVQLMDETSEDVEKLYELYPKGSEVLLWYGGVNECGAAEGRSSTKRNKEAESAVSKCSQQEAEVDSTYKELKERHQDSWDTPRLKLWARCIVSRIHDDYDNPPESPTFSSSAPKRA